MKTKILMVLLAGIVLLAACKGSGSYNNAESADTVAKQAQDSIKLVKTADMNIKVKDVRKAADQIAQATTECGGIVLHHDLKSEIVNRQDITLSSDSIKKMTVYNTHAEMTLKVPSEILENFMTAINQVGIYVDNRKMDVEDRTLDYLSEKLKAQNRQQSVKLRKHIKLTQKGADSLLTLKDDIVDKKIANLRTNQDVAMSTITLNLYQDNAVTAEIVANDDLSAYHTSLSTRMGLALSSGWAIFSDLLVGLLHLWAFILLGGAVWFGIIVYKHRKKNINQPRI